MTHDDVRWLSWQEQAVWLRILAVLELLPSTLDSQLRRSAKLTLTEYYVLAMLSHHPGKRLQTKQLAVRTNTTLSRLSRVITRLESEGLVARAANTADARATDVVLTESGLERLGQAAPEHVALVRKLIFDPQDASGTADLLRVTEAMLNVLDPDKRMHRDPIQALLPPGEDAVRDEDSEPPAKR